MSEATGGVVAGRLEVPVESDTDGFARELKRKIEAIAKGIKAKIGVELDEDGLRTKLKEVVDEAAAGIKANIEVDFDRAQAKAALERTLAGLGGSVDVEVRTSGSLVDDVERERSQAEREARRSPIEVLIQAKDRATDDLLRVIAAMKALARRSPVEVPIEGESSAGLMERVLGAGGGGSRGGKVFDPFSQGARSARRFLGLVGKVLAVLSLIEPAIAVIGSSLGGAAVMLGNLSTAVGVLAASPAALFAVSGIIGALLVGLIGVTGELGKMPKSMQDTVKVVKGFKDEWAALRREVQGKLFERAAGDLQAIIGNLLPQLQRGFVGAAEGISQTVHRFALLSGSKRFLDDLTVANDRVKDTTNSWGGVLVSVVDLLVRMAAAADPLVKRLNLAADDFARWMDGLLQTEQQRKEFNEFLQYAADKGAQAGRMIKSGWGAISGIFRAGRDSGDSLLASLENNLNTFNTWVNSAKGQNRIKEFFKNIEPVAREVGLLLIDLGKSLARMSENPKVAKLIKQIREDLVPALEKMLTALGGELGTKIVRLATALGELAAAVLADGGGGLGYVIGKIADAVEYLASQATKHPEAAKWITGIAAALLVLKGAGVVLTKLGLGGLLASIASGAKNALGSLFNRGGGGNGSDGADGDDGKKDAKKKQQVYWNRPMPVYIVGGPAGGGDDDGKKKTKPGKPSRPGGGSRGGGGGGGARPPLIIGGGGGDRSTRALPPAGPRVLPGPAPRPALPGPAGPNPRPAPAPRARNPLTRLLAGIGGAAAAGARGIGGAARSVANAARDQAAILRGQVRGATSRTPAPGARPGARPSARPGVGPTPRPGVGSSPADRARRVQPGRNGVYDLTGGNRGGGGGRGGGGLIRSILGRGNPATLVRSLGGAAKGAVKLAARGGVLGIAAGVLGEVAANKVNDGKGGTRQAAGGLIKGATYGAGIGATLGSFVPVVGTAIGGVAGGAIGGVIGAATSGADWGKVKDEISMGMDAAKVVAKAKGTELVDTVAKKSVEAADKVGLFKRDAEGKVVGLDLAAPGRRAIEALRDALPAPIQQALSNVDVFKRDAEGRVTGVNLAAPVQVAALAMANVLPQPIQDALTNVGIFKRDAEGNVTGIDLAGPVKIAATALVDSLPAPVQQALSNLGIFKRDAAGRISGIDLAGPGKAAVNGLANALPPGVQQALTNVGLFKRDAAGRVTVDLSGPARNAANSLANALPGGVQQALTNLGVFKRGADGSVSVDLSGSGRKVVSSFAAGIRGAAGLATSAMSAVVAGIRRLVPNSPVPEGPLRIFNDGGPGRKLVQMMADGVIAERMTLSNAMRSLAKEAAGTPLEVQSQVNAMRALTSAGASASSSTSALAAGGRGDVIFENGAITVYNPAPEPASQSIETRLRTVAAFGLFGE